MAARNRGQESLLSCWPLAHHLPNLAATNCVNGFNSCLSSLAAFRHALGGFEAVNIIRINAAITDAHALC